MADSPRMQIVAAAWRAIRGDYPVVRHRSGLCLRLVREIVENAMGWRSHDLYRRHVTTWTQPPGYPRTLGHWAVDAEVSLAALGWSVPANQAEPGDLIFWDNLAPVSPAQWKRWWPTEPYRPLFMGHVAIVIAPRVLLENIAPDRRPRRFANWDFLVVSPLGSLPNPSTVIRWPLTPPPANRG